MLPNLRAIGPDSADENKLNNLGMEDNWTLRGNYKRKAMEDFEHRPPDLDDPSSLEYMQSMKKLGNPYYSDFIDRKTEARKDLAAKGKMSKDYMNFINSPPGTIKPSGLKLFPALGMISNKATYQTHTSNAQQGVAREPMGIDAYDAAQHYIVHAKEVKWRDRYIQTKYMLRELKPPKLKKQRG